MNNCHILGEEASQSEVEKAVLGVIRTKEGDICLCFEDQILSTPISERELALSFSKYSWRGRGDPVIAFEREGVSVVYFDNGTIYAGNTCTNIPWPADMI